MLEGELSFWAGEPERPIGCFSAGSLVSIPRGTPHSYHVESPMACLLSIHTLAGYERFFRDGGVPAGEAGSDAGEPDMPKVLAPAGSTMWGSSARLRVAPTEPRVIQAWRTAWN